MNKDQRMDYLGKLVASEKVYGAKEIWYKNKRKKFNVYEIDLEYLIYNAYNHRIGSFVKSYEKQTGKKLDATNQDDALVIEKYLWESSEASNKETKKSLSEKRQLEYGIVTRDGVIIDGNRRAMLIKQLAQEHKEKPMYFLSVILDETLDENPKEIMRLETTYQMGEDVKVDYNAIEKYLTCKDLHSYGFENGEIGKMMGETDTTIKEYRDIMDLMDDYLEKLGYSGFYTRLEKTEGAFVDLYRYLKRYSDKKSGMISWNYTDSDVNDLKLIYYDYIQFMYNKKKKKDDEEEGIFGSEDSKDYRIIGKPSKRESLFCSVENIWSEFRDRHFDKVEPIREQFEHGDLCIDKLRELNPKLDLNEILKRRDRQWAEKVGFLLKENLGRGRNQLQNFNNQNEPELLLEKALSALKSIDIKAKSFSEKPEIEQLVTDINKIAWDFKQYIKQAKKN